MSNVVALRKPAPERKSRANAASAAPQGKDKVVLPVLSNRTPVSMKPGTFKKRIKKENETPPRSSFIWGSDLYDGAELRPYQGRPGANDALSFPSRNGDFFAYRKDAA